jgi:hypothetical protein
MSTPENIRVGHFSIYAQNIISGHQVFNLGFIESASALSSHPDCYRRITVVGKNAFRSAIVRPVAAKWWKRVFVWGRISKAAHLKINGRSLAVILKADNYGQFLFSLWQIGFNTNSDPSALIGTELLRCCLRAFLNLKIGYSGEPRVDGQNYEASNFKSKLPLVAAVLLFLFGSFLIGWGYWHINYGKGDWKGWAVFFAFIINVLAIVVFSSYCRQNAKQICDQNVHRVLPSRIFVICGKRDALKASLITRVICNVVSKCCESIRLTKRVPIFKYSINNQTPSGGVWISRDIAQIDGIGGFGVGTNRLRFKRPIFQAFKIRLLRDVGYENGTILEFCCPRWSLTVIRYEAMNVKLGIAVVGISEIASLWPPIQINNEPRALAFDKRIRAVLGSVRTHFCSPSTANRCSSGYMVRADLMPNEFALTEDQTRNPEIYENTNAGNQQVHREKWSIEGFSGWRYYVNLVNPICRIFIFGGFLGCGLWCAWYASILTLRWWQLALAVLGGCVFSTTACALFYDWMFRLYGR